MTTQVKIEVTQAHMPVVVEGVDELGAVVFTRTMDQVGHQTFEYVYSPGRTLRIREMTSAEKVAAGL